MCGAGPGRRRRALCGRSTSLGKSLTLASWCLHPRPRRHHLPAPHQSRQRQQLGRRSRHRRRAGTPAPRPPLTRACGSLLMLPHRRLLRRATTPTRCSHRARHRQLGGPTSSCSSLGCRRSWLPLARAARCALTCHTTCTAGWSWGSPTARRARPLLLGLASLSAWTQLAAACRARLLPQLSRQPWGRPSWAPARAPSWSSQHGLSTRASSSHKRCSSSRPSSSSSGCRRPRAAWRARPALLCLRSMCQLLACQAGQLRQAPTTAACCTWCCQHTRTRGLPQRTAAVRQAAQSTWRC